MKTIPLKEYVRIAMLGIVLDVGVRTAGLPGPPEEKLPCCVPIVAEALP